MENISTLQDRLNKGLFVITTEVSSPDSSDNETLNKRLSFLSKYSDAINATDASGAHCHMSSVAVCTLMVQQKIEPILQISCRDRNRIAIQGDILGANALGIKNMLCLTGDGVQTGDHPEAKPVFDLDSISLLETASTLKNKGTFLSGRKLEKPPNIFLGAAANPFVPPFEFRVFRLQKKIAAGCRFIQTQYCFDIERFKTFMHQAYNLGLTERCSILVGVGPLRSARVAEWMTKNVPGIVIPEKIIQNLKNTPKKHQKTEGKKICIELINEIQNIQGVSGIHIMAYLLEELVPEIIQESELLNKINNRNNQ